MYLTKKGEPLAKKLLQDLQSRNERMFLVTFLVLNTADNPRQLDNNVFQASSIAQKYNCRLTRLDFQQEARYAPPSTTTARIIIVKPFILCLSFFFNQTNSSCVWSEVPEKKETLRRRQIIPFFLQTSDEMEFITLPYRNQ